MPNDSTYVIAGAGLAGAVAAQTLREHGYDGPLTLIGDERDRPYERPPLSKDYLRGKTDREAIYVHPPNGYREHDVQLRLGQLVSGFDPAAHAVTLADGSRLSYAKLLLTTGSSPRHLARPGAELDGVHYLRRVGDSDRIKDALGLASRIAVIGAGWIGLETAAAARAAGVQVTVLETAQLPLLRVLGPEMAQVFADLHRAYNVDLRCGVRVEEIAGTDGHADGVCLGDGSQIRADAVIVGVGVSPLRTLWPRTT
jgi:3-phenylpropionate/trans-cinnamate dioxygenase ferredoxin reductase component